MTNVREFKPKKKVEHECITCPDCDGQDIILWLVENMMIAACSECDTVLDLTGYTICPSDYLQDT